MCDRVLCKTETEKWRDKDRQRQKGGHGRDGVELEQGRASSFLLKCLSSRSWGSERTLYVALKQAGTFCCCVSSVEQEVPPYWPQSLSPGREQLGRLHQVIQQGEESWAQH